jgi:hypothetical protein
VKVDLKAKKLNAARTISGSIPRAQSLLSVSTMARCSPRMRGAAIYRGPGARLGPVAARSGAQPLRVLEWLNYVGTELHKGYSPLWNPGSTDEAKQATRELLAKKFDYVQQQLGEAPISPARPLPFPMPISSSC